MIQNVEDCLRLIELNNIEWWQVSISKDDNTKVFDSLEDETLEARKNRFREVMKLTTGGRFIFKGRKNKADARGQFSDELVNQPGNNAAIGAIPTTPVMNGIPKEDVQGMIDAALERERTKNELKQLKEERDELKKELRSRSEGMDLLVKNVTPHVGSLIGLLFPKLPSVGIAGTTQTIETPEQESDIDFEPVAENESDEQSPEQLRLETALQRWATADPDFLQVLEFIADFASNGTKISPFPGINLDYPAIKAMLK